jgi:hypothetical protein
MMTGDTSPEVKTRALIVGPIFQQKQEDSITLGSTQEEYEKGALTCQKSNL